MVEETTDPGTALRQVLYFIKNRNRAEVNLGIAEDVWDKAIRAHLKRIGKDRDVIEFACGADGRDRRKFLVRLKTAEDNHTGKILYEEV